MSEEKVRASKEQCRRVIQALERLSSALTPGQWGEHTDDVLVIDDFLGAALKRLPTEAAYDAAAARARERARQKRRA